MTRAEREGAEIGVELLPHEHALPPRAALAPSNIDIWRGARAPGQRFTGGQLAQMEAREIDPATVEVMVVRRPAGMDEMWWPGGQLTPIFVMPCPVLEERPRGYKVITPYGADGWVLRSGRAARWPL